MQCICYTDNTKYTTNLLHKKHGFMQLMWWHHHHHTSPSMQWLLQP